MAGALGSSRLLAQLELTATATFFFTATATATCFSLLLPLLLLLAFNYYCYYLFLIPNGIDNKNRRNYRFLRGPDRVLQPLLTFLSFLYYT